MASIPYVGRLERSKKSWELAVPLLPIACSVFLLSAFTWYRIQGSLGDGLLASVVVAIHDFLGFEPAFMLCLLVMAWSSIWFFTARIEELGSRVLKILALTLCLAILVNLKVDGAVSEQGGILGTWLAARLKYVFGFTLSTLIVAGAAILFFWLATDSFFYRYFEGIGRGPAVPESVLDDEGVEPATVQAFESLAKSAVTTGATRSEETRARPTLVLEEDPLDRVFPGPLANPIARSSEEAVISEEEIEFEDEVEDASMDFETEEAEFEIEEEEEEGLEDAAEEDYEAEDYEAEEEDGYEAEFSAESEESLEEEDADEFVEDAEIEAFEDESELIESDSELWAEGVENEILLPRPRRHSRRQGNLFPVAEGEQSLIDEAARLVIDHDRASASFLRRRLRISRQEAIEVFQELGDLGVVDCPDGTAQGRVVMDLGTWESQS